LKYVFIKTEPAFFGDRDSREELSNFGRKRQKLVRFSATEGAVSNKFSEKILVSDGDLHRRPDCVAGGNGFLHLPDVEQEPPERIICIDQHPI
jgi:hypothetical protein